MRQYIRLIAPTGPSILRHVSQTLIQAARASNADPVVSLPSLRDRAKGVVNEQGLLVAQDDIP